MTAPLPNPNLPLSGVSVVIPCYNYAHFLPGAIDSVLRQAYAPLEIIVVDDGSTDRTREVVAAYGRQVRYLYKPNAGLSAARNTGIAAARFPFVAFLDADDDWLPGMLKKIMEAFAELPAEFALVACRCVSVDSAGHLLELKQLDHNYPREITVKDMLLKTRFQPSGAVARRSVFETCGEFDDTLRSSEDRDMWIRIATRRRVYLLGEPLIRFRNHPNSMSKHADRMKENIGRVLAKARRSPDLSALSVQFWCQAHSFFDYQTAWMYRDEGRHRQAFLSLLSSWRRFPFFWAPHELNENYFFRLRSCLQFFWEVIRGRAPHEEKAAMPPTTLAGITEKPVNRPELPH